ncbi:short chain dehydrogenase [Metarhizium acridum CQMa 102]|uniref:Hydroxynaphthalene reductase-like protein Arp2 n=1 Tax=Metarhizium acridum (strain CQMa 102) TaxID=655827 RepID=E9EDH8_METAQ|nr:short chain dehydrogenase [Metarhizium acridum CQMa 102]EFY86042.1 short chain dehydrogenase [Metarhizium acridum CQMa 102]
MLLISRRLSPFRSASIAGGVHSRGKKLLPEFDPSGKVVVVSGGTGGLGLAQAEALLEAGANDDLGLTDLPLKAYNTSKGAVPQLCRSLAAEWGQHGIRVNTLSPGYITAEVVQSLLDEFPERRESWSRDNMLNRLSLSGEYRGAAVFLISDASSFMTGSDLRIDGGHVAW